MDLSFGMLAWDAAARPPGAVADIRSLPLAAQFVHDAVAAFVPKPPHRPLRRARRAGPRHTPGGARAGRRFQHHQRRRARDRIDAVAQDAGWQIPAWYTQLKTTRGADPRQRHRHGRRRPALRRSFRSVRPLTDGPLAGDNVA
jgi:hypothetical protein